MAKILGLDLGTNSIGWAIVEKENNDFSLVDKGVRIFSEGVKSEKGIESSRAAERTAFRSARKLKYRRKLRKYETLKVLSENGMCPLSFEEVEEWKKSGFKKYPLNPEFLKWLRTDEDQNINPYVFRDRASKQKVSLFELGRALYHIAQRRGFLSNRLDQSAEGILEEHCPQINSLIEDCNSNTEILIELKDYFFNVGILDETNKGGFKKELDEGEAKLKTLYNALLSIVKRNENKFIEAKEEIIARLNRKEDLGKVKGKIKDISQAMIDGNFKTLGQYFFSLYNKNKIRNQYTSREEHYLYEFIEICKIQEIDNIDENEKLAEKKFSGLAKDLYKAIFFQRPLKSQKGLIGKCSFEKSKTRCAISHPDFEEYRMWSYLNTIKMGTQSDKTLRFLSQDEKLGLISKFLRKKDNFNFEDLAKELIPKGATFGFYKSSKANEVNYLFNYKPYDTVTASPVSASLKNIFGEDWKTKTISYKTKNSKGIEVNRSVDYKDLWHLLSVSTSDIYLFQYGKEKLGLDDKNAKAFSKIRLKKDFASLSLNAITKILSYVREGLLYSHAVFMANIEGIVDESIWNDSNQRKFIQDKIAEIIENHTFENGKLEAINSLIKECKTVGAFYSKEAESIYKSDLDKKLIPFVKFHKIESDKEAILNELFPVLIEQLKKYEYIKINRLDEKVLDFIKGKNDDGEIFCTNEKRINKLYHPSDIEVFKKKIIKDEFGNEKVVLGSPLTSSIKNPMAMRALHQLRKVLNTLIFEGQVDEKTIIHIEMARELNDANKRKGIQDYQNENKKNREEYAKDIRKLYFEECKKEIEPTEDDLLRYQLWLEQNKQEIYEEGRNISICDIIGKDPKYDFEHTVPRSRSQDNSQMNKTLCSQKFNREIKGNKMPIELNNYLEILPRIAHWKEESDNLTREIEIISRSIKAAATKELKDKKIRRRHYLTLKRDYLKGKYDRFIWEEPKVGFKNSQIPDTGIITKYSQAYLKSYFKRVESVKGGMVAEFRKIWGIQESFQENDKKYFHEKDRSKHTHHTIDAITIACMTKEKYDALANAWTHEDKGQLGEARKLLADSKPWKTFKEDLKKIEEEILVSHYTPDNVKKQSKKIVRVRGKKQYVAETVKDVNGKAIVQKDVDDKIIFRLNKEGKRIPRLQQGDTIRGSLHQDSIYGAIKNPLNTEEIRYVIRKDLESIKASDVENIVDEMVKAKVKEAITNKVLLISSNAQQKNKLDGIVWMNEEKGIPINKVRLYANSVKNPLEIKMHSDLSKSRHEHKQKVYAQNDENFAMAIYEDFDKKGKIKRSYEMINNIDAGSYYKLSNAENKINYDIVTNPHDKTGLPLKYILRKGLLVLFFKENHQEILELPTDDLHNRLYKLAKFDAQGRLTFRTHFEARQASDLKEIYDVDFETPFEQIRLQVSKLNMLVEGYEFKLSSSGKITFI
ncbi:type II CRISPR RNA-guided endonuclease Cas9 [Flavobacterium granuli]|uniref:CRISPR-associated endonuclease Cas9 n=1 Tax=Flavobacterium granuli TaxID=280093 RepID=A0A1M5J1T7_9FLAO|nr:type II CRISPR RNA-guided endonuclease Cas9 [Flavobacterium granuli]PRZ28184.1 CRISPR-associated endonuclease Csn1 [Flavobacterium granuli]SHG33983.1 CRISPR-associated endonuclease Csn1 [Flavobacterium granuli]